VQHAGKDAGVVTSSSLSFKSNNTAGNWIGVCIRAGHSGQVFTVRDSAGNTYHQAIQFNVTVDAPGGDTLGIFYAENIAGGANTITVSDTISGTLRFSILEYSGVAIAGSLDAAVAGQGHGSAPNSGNAATSASGDLLLGANLTANPASFTAGSGYKIEENVPAEPNTKLIAEDQIQAAPGSVSATAVLAAVDDWAAGLAAFKSAGGAGVAPVISSLNPTSGRVGYSVTITGTNFGSSTGSVTFNGTAVTGGITWTPTRIDVTVPNGATTGNVVVTAGGLSSNGVSFTVVPGPAITNLNPTSGSVGTSVQISGASFGTPQGSSTVTFNGTVAIPTSWSSNLITVPVPSGATTGNVVVTVAGVPSNGINFTVTIISVSVAPPTANVAAGTTAFFTATLQNDVRGQSVIWSLSGAGCSGTACGTVSAPAAPSQAQYTAPTTVPNPATVVLTATSIADNTKSGQATITVVQPQVPNIASLNPTSGPINTSVTIAGTNFGSSQGASTVTFGGVQASTANWSDTSITAIVPGTASTGNVAVTVNGNASNGVVFTVTPHISTLSLTQGPVGASITITGSTFGATPGSVTFNGISATPTAWSATSIDTTVPAGATTGNVIVTVSGVASNGLPFTVTPPPNIASINPTSGAIGAVVTINGTNFGPTVGTRASVVSFNGVVGRTTSWSDTQIVVPVPAGAASGNVVVSVGGVASNGFAFNVTSSGGGIGIAQHTSTDAGVTTSASLTFQTSNQAGNWIGVCIRAGRSGQVFTVTDANGNVYHRAVQFNVSLDAPGGDTLGIFYAENIFGGLNTVTVSDTISGTLRFAILEYTGVALVNSLDNAVSAQGHSTSPDSGNLVTTANGDLLLGAILTANPAVFTAGSGYTLEETAPAEPGTKLIAEDQIQAAAANAAATATLGGADDWAAGVAAFKSASGSPPPPISVTVSPTPVNVGTGGLQNFTANVQSDFQRKGATWSLSGAGCSGNTCGTLTNITATSVTYQGPATVPSPATVTLTATSVSDTSKSGSATITVVQGTLSVSVSPKRSALTASQTQQFTATVSNDPLNGGVTWAVEGNNGGNATTGTITAAGLFTPGTQPGLYKVTATTSADASVSATVTVAVTDLTGVLTYHNDNARTGQNLKEYALTTSTVNSSTFGQLFSCPVDGYVYAQPLFVANLTVGGVKHNVVYIATEHDSVYAFDADSASCAQLWKTSFLGIGVGTMSWQDTTSGTNDVFPEIGITSTPVIDPVTNTMYVEAKTKETVGTGCSAGLPCYFNRLHALNITTGAEMAAVEITAPNFDPLRHFGRPALLLNNSTIYVGMGSHGDGCNWQGWLFAYDPATLKQNFAWSTSNPSGCNGAAIWQGGDGPAADASGNVYVITGNGTYDGSKNFSESVLKLSSTGSLLDWFTPFNYATLDANDVDMGSAGPLILPDSVGSATHPHLLLATGKIAMLFLLDQTNMGKFHSGSNLDLQEVIPVPPPNTTQLDGGNYGVVAYWNGNIYSTGQNFPLSQFTISNGVIATPQWAKSANTFPPRGAVPAVSASGSSNGIVWVLDLSGWTGSGRAVLYAYDATNVANLLYSSPATGTGAAAPAVKFTVPTVANGKVYVGGQGSVTVFGLLPN
jgi:hypothetical protein